MQKVQMLPKSFFSPKMPSLTINLLECIGDFEAQGLPRTRVSAKAFAVIVLTKYKQEQYWYALLTNYKRK